MRDLSFSLASPHQAGKAYIVLAMMVVRVISCRESADAPWFLSVLRAKIEAEPLLTTLLMCSVTESFSSMVTPRAFIEVERGIPVIEGLLESEDWLCLMTAISRVLEEFIFRFFSSDQLWIC